MTNPTRKASEIGFGIEIECNIPQSARSAFPVGRYHSGAQVSLAGFDGWTTQADSSVRSTGNFYPAEIVSPVLYGEAGLIKVVEMLDFLNSIGAKINASCGLHVHVDCKNADVKRIAKLFRAYEVAFYDMNGENAQTRYTSNYCLPTSRWNGTRYQSLNLKHTTETNPHIEIRVWQGAMKPETVVAAIYMAVSLVSRATSSEKVSVRDIDTTKPAQVMEKFINRFMDSDTMIVPEFDPHDIWQEMMEAVRNSNRAR